jgi:hypothetical protein
LPCVRTQHAAASPYIDQFREGMSTPKYGVPPRGMLWSVYSYRCVTEQASPSCPKLRFLIGCGRILAGWERCFPMETKLYDMLTDVVPCQRRVGAVLSIEYSRLARNQAHARLRVDAEQPSSRVSPETRATIPAA